MVPRISLCIHFLGDQPLPNHRWSLFIDNLFGVAIESTGEDSGPLRFLLGVGVCTVFLPLGVENRLLFIWSVLGICPGVSIGDDSCSIRLFRGVDSLAFSANFRLGVVNAPIPGWDFLLPWGILFRDFNF